MATKLNLETICNHWKDKDVPEVESIKYDEKLHRRRGPWEFKVRGVYTVNNTNPLAATASHLMLYLKNKPPELRILYKIYAFALDRGAHHHHTPIFRELFAVLNEDLQWWSSNTKHVLPTPEYSVYCSGDPKMKNFLFLIDSAATYWRKIADKFVIIRVPSFMDENSEEYKELVLKEEQRQEAQEYSEYLRLKKKYDRK